MKVIATITNKSIYVIDAENYKPVFECEAETIYEEDVIYDTSSLLLQFLTNVTQEGNVCYGSLTQMDINCLELNFLDKIKKVRGAKTVYPTWERFR